MYFKNNNIMSGKLIYCLSVFLLIITSCDSYLEEIPPHSLVESNVITDQATAESALIGTYYPLESINPSPFGANYVSNGSHMVGFTSGSFGNLDEESLVNTFTKGNGWEKSSDMINAANLIIEKIEDVADMEFDENRKNEIRAEARFLRFFAQYYLFRHYGQFWDINSNYGGLMRRTPARLSSNDFARSTVAETYDLLFEDLDFVIENGPEFTTVYRASSLLAMAYKAEVLLMRGDGEDLQNAIVLADQVLNNSSRAKEATYEAVFENGYDSSELLFTRFMDENNLSFVFRFVDSMVQMFGGRFDITPQLENLLGDDLRTPFYKRIDIVDGEEVVRVPKIYKDDGNCVLYYMRTSQMDLVKAEAYARMNQKINAIDAINVLRIRAGEDELVAGDISDNELSMVIFNEIAREMALEKGYEWFTAIRLKNLNNEPLIFEIKDEVTSINQFIWPIPLEEVEFNLLIVQNPGYENL